MDILKRKFKIYFTVFFIIYLFFSCNAFCKNYKGLKFIDVNNPFINKIPVAVPEFIQIESNPELADIVVNGHKYLEYLLKFTSYFEIIEKNGKLAGVVGSRIDFDKWKKNGVELLVTSGVFLKDDILEMEIRLFDTIKNKLVIGKRYKGKSTDYKKMLRRFASSCMFELFGNKGLFQSKIVFVSAEKGSKDLYICDFDGKNIKRITNDKSIAISPSWSYDNKWLAYTSYKRGIPEIFVKSLKSNKGYIISHGNLNITPAWKPGSFSMAAVFSINRDSDIFFVSGQGKIINTIVKSWGIDVSPCFSPDGKKIVFVSGRSGGPQIYIKDLDSKKVKRLTFEGDYNTSPSWSPLGEYIVFVGKTAKHGINIYSIRPDGRDLKMLTSNSGENEDPTWSPDGSLIAFTSTRAGKKKVFVMTRSGEDQRMLVCNMAGSQSDPAWSH
ncbi:MAG: Tol-Pal system beta propeller repeat protein TolB [Deltaproteobacteria bacterium]|nr:MAG: Tol-Pal system beta propeller repeat protein TolB [Deltaproteobacteria bacterium]